MAARDRVLMTSVWILTRPKPHVSKACPSSSSFDSGLTVGAPPAGAVHRPAEVHVLPHVSTSPSALDPTMVPAAPEGAVPDETHGVCRPAGSARRDGVRDERLASRPSDVCGRHHRESLLVATRVGVDGEESRERRRAA